MCISVKLKWQIHLSLTTSNYYPVLKCNIKARMYAAFYSSDRGTTKMLRGDYARMRTWGKASSVTNFRSANLHIPAPCTDALWTEQAQRICSPLPLARWGIHSVRITACYTNPFQEQRQTGWVHAAQADFPRFPGFLSQRSNLLGPLANSSLHSFFPSAC